MDFQLFGRTYKCDASERVGKVCDVPRLNYMDNVCKDAKILISQSFLGPAFFLAPQLSLRSRVHPVLMDDNEVASYGEGKAAEIKEKEVSDEDRTTLFYTRALGHYQQNPWTNSPKRTGVMSKPVYSWWK